MTPLPDIYLAHLEAAGSGDGTALQQIWEPDGLVEFPYATSIGSPGRLEGIDSIVEYFGGLSLFGPFTVGAAAGWSLGHSEWLAELHGSSTVLATGKPYEQDYIVRFRVSESGRLAWMREYWDPTRM